MASYRTLLVGIVVGMAFGIVFMWEMVGEQAMAGAGHDHGVPAPQHQPIDLLPNQPIPEVTLKVMQDPLEGWNLHVETTNFTFTPEHSGDVNRAGEGHAHLYVDGRKYARLYGPWFHLPPLAPGEHELVVSLNANDHAPLHLDGKPIETRLSITQR